MGLGYWQLQVVNGRVGVRRQAVWAGMVQGSATLVAGSRCFSWRVDWGVWVVVVVAAVDMVAGLLRWWVLGLGGVSRFLSCESGSLGRLVPFDVDVRDGYCGDL